jgi:hypothetical protein
MTNGVLALILSLIALIALGLIALGLVLHAQAERERYVDRLQCSMTPTCVST